MVTFDRVSKLYTPCHQENNQSLIVQFSSFVCTGAWRQENRNAKNNDLRGSGNWKFVGKCYETCSKTTPNHQQIEFKPSQIDTHGLKNRFRGPPRHHFGQSSCFKHLKKACFLRFWCPEGDFGFLFGPQNLPRLRPKCEKCDVEKQHDFCIIFSMVQAWFWAVFFVFFRVAILLKSAKWLGKKAYETLAMATKTRVGLLKIS